MSTTHQRKKPKSDDQGSQPTSTSSGSSSSPSNRTTNVVKTLLKVVFLVIAVIIALVFFLHQVLQQQSTFSAPGTLYTVGYFGQNIHLYCTQAEKTQKDFVVLFHHGLLGTSADWYPLQLQLQKAGISSCSYDRPGFGFSPIPQTNNPPTLSENTNNLDELIQNHSLLKGGNILHVGHSIGGTFSYGYALQNPSLTRGVILLDPLVSLSSQKSFQSSLYIFGVLTKLGINRLLHYLQILPFEHKSEITIGFSLQDKFANSVTRELEALQHILKELKQLQQPSQTFPVIWVSSTKPSTTFSAIPVASLKFLQTKEDQTISQITSTRVTVDTCHVDLPFSSELFQIITQFK